MINNDLQKALNELKNISPNEGEVSLQQEAKQTEDIKANEEFLNSERVDASAIITLSRNNMTARLKLKAPSKGGGNITLEIIEKAMEEQGVKFGINKEYINRLISFSVYDKSFIIAQGLEPTHGKDEYVEFLIDLEDDLTPTILEDGSTDYKNLGYHKSVEPNEKLGIVHPATLGEAGCDVLGNETPALDGKNLPVSPLGANTVFDKDNLTILASTSGNVSFKKNKIDVRHEKVVKNVDSSTGNINFEGDVRVLNDVLEGFSIKCKGNIKVAGVVENALLISGGDVIVAKGIHGENCKVYSEGGIRTVHIESASLHCKGSIYADYSLNANIISDEEIYLEGAHGYIIGGSAIATKKIEVGELGNDVNMLTTVELLDSHFIDHEIEEINNKIEHYTKEIDKLTRAWQNISHLEMSIEERRQYTERIITLRKEYSDKLQTLSIEHDRIEEEKACEGIESVIVVKKKVYNNVLIKINGVETKTNNIKSKCNIISSEGRIKFVT